MTGGPCASMGIVLGFPGGDFSGSMVEAAVAAGPANSASCSSGLLELFGRAIFVKPQAIIRAFDSLRSIARPAQRLNVPDVTWAEQSNRNHMIRLKFNVRASAAQAMVPVE